MVSWPSLTLLASEVRQRPGITAWPIFIFLLLTISFEVGVYEGAQLWEASSKTDARSLAMSTSSAFSNRFQGATALLNAASSVIHVDAMSSNPSNWTVMRSYLEGLLTDLIESYNVNLIQVLPMGITELLVPEGSTTIELGSNFFLTSILPAMQTEALLLNTWPNDTVLGPFKFSDPGWGVNVVSLIFLPNSVNISRLALPHNPFFGNCTLCKSVNPGHQLWGLAIVYLDLSDVRSGLDPSLSQLSSKYDYILWENGAYSQYENASISRVDITLIGNCTPFTNPITVAFNVIAGNTWYLDLQPKGCNGSWTPPWELPLLVLLPFICLALSLFVLTHQVEHSRHVRLLSSLVPKDSFPIDNSVANGSGRNSQQDNSGEMAFPSSQQRRLESLLTHTPADRILTVVGQLLKGSMPEIEDVMAIRRAIEERRDLYAAPRGLQDRMERHLASDVASYMTLLTINNRKQTLPKTDPKPSKEDCHELVCVLSSGALERHELSVLQMIAEVRVEEPLRELLAEACNDFRFSIWRLKEATNDHALTMLCFYILTVDTNVAADLGLNLQALCSFLRSIESQYNDHHYHNKTHAADVLQMLHMITKSSLFKCGIADTALVKLAYVIAATVHDVDHYGLNNDFLVNSRNTLAVIHNDRSPMESHHCSLTFTTLYGPDTDFTALLSPADQKVFRSLVIDLVLATDMKQHFNILSQFTSSSRLGNKKSESGPGPSPLSGNSSTPQPGAVAPPCSGGGPSHLSSPLGLVKRDDSDDKLARRSPAVERGLKKPSLGVTSANVSPRGAMGTLLRLNSLRQVTPVDAVPYHPKNDGEKLVCLQVALKIADVSSIFRPFNVALRSIHGLEEEFFRQGDKERELGMPLTPLFDRTKAGVSKAQKGFIDFIAMPLLKSFVHVFPECQPLLLELKLNYVELEAMNKAIPSPAVDNNSAGIVQEVAEHRHQEVAEHRHQAIGVEKYGQGDEEHFKKDSIKSLLSDHEGTQ